MTRIPKMLQLENSLIYLTPTKLILLPTGALVLCCSFWNFLYVLRSAHLAASDSSVTAQSIKFSKVFPEVETRNKGGVVRQVNNMRYISVGGRWELRGGSTDVGYSIGSVSVRLQKGCQGQEGREPEICTVDTSCSVRYVLEGSWNTSLSFIYNAKSGNTFIFFFKRQ